MSFKTLCPLCKKGLLVREESIGHRARCPYCRGMFEVHQPDRSMDDVAPASAEARNVATQPGAGAPVTMIATQPGAATGAVRPDPAGAPLLWTGLIAVGATSLLYVLCYPLPTNLYLRALLWGRGPVQPAIMLLTFWSAAVLFVKHHKLRRQRDSLLFDVLPVEIAAMIRRDNLHRFVTHLGTIPCDPASNFLVNRVRRALDHFRTRGSAPEVATQLASQGEIDATAVDSSHAMLRVFIWAIPILGFIGTVMGIGAAVGGFNTNVQGASEMDALKESLTTITGGLATAFDTTFLGLVMSMLIMFPMSFLRKGEEDLLNSITDYCNENLLRRLDDASATAQTPEVDQFKTAVRTVLAEHAADFQGWVARLEKIGTVVTRQVVEGWEAIHTQLQDGYRRQAEQVRDLLGAVTDERRAAASQTKVIADDQAVRLGELMKTMAETAERVQRQLAEVQGAQARGLGDATGRIEVGLRELQIKLGADQQAQIAVVGNMTRDITATLSDLAARSGEAWSELTLAARNAAPGLSAEMRQVVGELREAVETSCHLLESGVHDWTDRLGELCGTHAQRLTEASEEMRATLRRGEEESAAREADVLRRIETLAGTVAAAQCRLGEQIATMMNMVERSGVLAQVGDRISQSLEILGQSDGFGVTMGRIDQTLQRLEPLLAQLDTRPPAPTDERTRQLSRRRWLHAGAGAWWFGKNKSHGST